MTTHTELAAKAGVNEEKSDGELWSFLRSVMSQGAAIYQDYQVGKYATYEHYSARLDAAASDRVDLLRAALSTERLAGGGEPEPFAWATFDGEGGYDLRLYQDNEGYRDQFIKRNGPQFTSWVLALYTTPPPQAERLPLSSKQRKHSCDDPLCAVCGHGIGTPKEST